MDTETVSHDIDRNGTSELKRVIDRSRDNLNRDTGWKLGTGAQYMAGWEQSGSPDLENEVVYKHDTAGRITTIRGGGLQPPSQFIYTYELNSHHLTNTAYKPDGTVQETSGAQTYRTTHTYDYAQRMVGMTTYGTETATTTWKYSTDRGFLTEKIHPGEINNGAASADYAYTDAGRLLTRTWERGVTTTYGYDGGGRRTSTDYGDATPDVSITYDALNRPDEVTSGTSIWNYEYDSITLRLVSETHPLGGTSTERVLTRSYDSLSRPDGFDLGTPADPDLDHTVSYGFDDAGRYGNVTGAGKSFGYTYTAGDLIDTVTGPTHTVINTWDKPRRTIHTKNNEVDSVTVSQYTYGVNHIGQRETVQTTGTAFGNTNRGWAWGYDSLGQATKAVNAADTALNRTYGFDGIGNRTSATDGSGGSATTVGYTPNALNQYEAINPGTEVNPTYDADGNLRNDAGINALTYGLKYEWDAENRLIAVHKADDTLIATYAYDYMSRRIRKTTTADAYPYQGAGDTAYLYDGWNVVAEYSITGGSAVALVQAYTWGLDLSGSMQGAGGVGGLLSIHRGPGTDGNGDRTWTDTFHPTYDGNGNVSEYLDKDGDEAAHFEYDPFGNLAATTGTPASFTYRFSTKPQDFETGLYYYGYRYYDPVTGRWPSRDPIEEAGGINLYGYVGNDGVNRWDYLGMKNTVYGETGDPYSPEKAKEVAEATGKQAMLDSITEYETLLRQFRSNKKNDRTKTPIIGPREWGGWVCENCKDDPEDPKKPKIYTYYTTLGKSKTWPKGANTDHSATIHASIYPKCNAGDLIVASWHTHPPRWEEPLGGKAPYYTISGEKSKQDYIFDGIMGLKLGFVIRRLENGDLIITN